MIKKFIIAEKMESNDEEGTIVGWASKPGLDRDKEYITADAWKLENYKKNPILMLSHDYSLPPVGKSLWTKSDSNGLRFKAKFANTERGKEIYQLYKDGIMSAFSVGFSPNAGGVIDSPKDVKYKGAKKVYTDVELLEISCVAIPANSQALVEYVKSGKIVTKQLKDELEFILEIKDNEEIEVKTKDFIPEEIKEEDLKNIVTKAIDATDTPSFNKITRGIEGKINSIEPKIDLLDRVNGAGKYRYINDIFPINFPDGYVIYNEWDSLTPSAYFKIDYTFNKDTEEVLFNGVPIAVEQGWAEKTYGMPDVTKENGGFITKLCSTIVQKIEVTEDFIHVPAPGEEGDHKDHKIRTISISKKEGIQGKYCIDDKIVIGYTFDKQKDWDKEKAKKWVEEHSKSFEVESSDEDIDNIVFKGVMWDKDGDVKFKAIEEVVVKAMMPETDEEMAAFMDRCMADEKMMADNPKDEDRKGACQLIWDEKKPASKEAVVEEIKLSDEDIIKKLQEQLVELKCSMEGMTAKVSDIPTSSITKTADSSGNSSLYDITTVVSDALNSPLSGVIVNPSGNYMNNCYSVVDVYPVDFPNGHVVYSVYNQNKNEFFQIDYTFDIATRKASLSGTPVSVLQSWVEGRYGEQQTMIKEVDNVITKEGRVLSDANRQLLMDCITQMKGAIDAVNALVSATEPVKKPIMSITVEDLFKDVDDIEIEEIPVVTKDDDIDVEIPEVIVKEADTVELEEDTLDIDEEMVRDVIKDAFSSMTKGIDIRGMVTENVAKRMGRVII